MTVGSERKKSSYRGAVSRLCADIKILKKGWQVGNLTCTTHRGVLGERCRNSWGCCILSISVANSDRPWSDWSQKRCSGRVGALPLDSWLSMSGGIPKPALPRGPENFRLCQPLGPARKHETAVPTRTPTNSSAVSRCLSRFIFSASLSRSRILRWSHLSFPCAICSCPRGDNQAPLPPPSTLQNPPPDSCSPTGLAVHPAPTPPWQFSWSSRALVRGAPHSPAKVPHMIPRDPATLPNSKRYQGAPSTLGSESHVASASGSKNILFDRQI